MKLQEWRKGLLIGFFALVISTLGIQASDEIKGVSSRLSSSVIQSGSTCEKNSVLTVVEGRSVCVDTYEASPSSRCLYSTPESEQETKANLTQAACSSVSNPEVTPWRFVTYTEAQQICARSGKRLPTNNEWYKNALSISDPAACFTNKSLMLTGQNNCYTQNNISDLVGNVWEWIEDVVVDGRISGRTLPNSGYVDLVDNTGMVIETSQVPNTSFGSDYAWINTSGVRGILRGGFYGSAKDGGIFSQNISVELDFATAGVGFRCVKDL